MKLVGDASNAGVNCWLDTKDMRTGASIEQEIRRGLSSQDKLLLVLSRFSAEPLGRRRTSVLRCPWNESAEEKKVVFPLRLDSSVFESDSPRLTV